MLGLGSSIVRGGVLEEWTPLKLGSALDLWLQHKTGITSDESGSVSQWDDQSGNSRHAQQDTAGNRPSFSSGKFVHFDDDSDQDYLTLATGTGGIEYTANGSGVSQPFTIMVGMIRDTNTESDRFIGGDSSEFIGIGGAGTALSADRIQVRGAGTLCVPIFDDHDILTIGEEYVLTVTRDTSMNIRVYKNNDALLLDSSTSGYDADNPTRVAMSNDSTSMDLKRIGAGASTTNTNAFDGKIFDVIVCNTLLSDEDRNLAINYMKGSFG
jgi:hypothetical protein